MSASSRRSIRSPTRGKSNPYPLCSALFRPLRAQDRPAAGDHVERRDRLGEQGRVSVRDAGDHRATGFATCERRFPPGSSTPRAWGRPPGRHRRLVEVAITAAAQASFLGPSRLLDDMPEERLGGDPGERVIRKVIAEQRTHRPDLAAGSGSGDEPRSGPSEQVSQTAPTGGGSTIRAARADAGERRYCRACQPTNPIRPSMRRSRPAWIGPSRLSTTCPIGMPSGLPGPTRTCVIGRRCGRCFRAAATSCWTSGRASAGSATSTPHSGTSR